MIDSDIDPFADAECPHSAPENWTAGTILLAAASGRLPRVQWQADMEPLIWLDGEEPPFLLIHGDEDRIIPLQRSEQLAAELQAAGVTVELLILPEAGHLFPVYGAGRAEAWQAVDEFLAEQIGLD
jgi:acetyl esterase/lipase